MMEINGYKLWVYKDTRRNTNDQPQGQTRSVKDTQSHISKVMSFRMYSDDQGQLEQSMRFFKKRIFQSRTFFEKGLNST